ncbi:hypothetical protein MUK42_27328 [Musa troglodytarum]|uniref:Uncharacterized protein n=1 Tax=Musa troglodytarum TaxID=320322 RepID=A0A9E7FAK6_9LILI|nr:hypothetical protein MUK42_27328 [Musa troglodytarum]
MGIFGWVQNKFPGRQEKKSFDAGSSSAHYPSMPSSQKEELNDWPQALLSIGTLGNSEMKEEPRRDEHSQILDSSEDLSNFTIEEVSNLQRELKKLLSLKSKTKSAGSEFGEEDRAKLPLNRFLNCPSSLEVDRIASAKLEHLDNDNNGDLSPNTKIILSKLKEVLLGNRNAIKKKSISFLLKRMLVCGGGFAPAPGIRDPMPESRMEKILRAILTKKMHQQSSAPSSSKKYLENKPVGRSREGEEEEEEEEEEKEEKRKAQCKWVKTDSECEFNYCCHFNFSMPRCILNSY